MLQPWLVPVVRSSASLGRDLVERHVLVDAGLARQALAFTADGRGLYLVGAPAGDAERSDLAAEFVTLVRSNRARQVLQDAGFSGVVAE